MKLYIIGGVEPPYAGKKLTRQEIDEALTNGYDLIQVTTQGMSDRREDEGNLKPLEELCGQATKTLGI